MGKTFVLFNNPHIGCTSWQITFLVRFYWKWLKKYQFLWGIVNWGMKKAPNLFFFINRSQDFLTITNSSTSIWLVFLTMLTFCPVCANVLVVEDGERCMRFACDTCPYIQNITKTVGNFFANKILWCKYVIHINTEYWLRRLVNIQSILCEKLCNNCHIINYINFY